MKKIALLILSLAFTSATAIAQEDFSKSDDPYVKRVLEAIEKLEIDKVPAILEEGCNNKSALSCYQLGKNANESSEYTLGHGYFVKSCELNHFAGCKEVGDNFSVGVGVEKSLSNAKKYYQKACDGKNYESCFAIGMSILSNPKHNQSAKPVPDANLYFSSTCNDKVQAMCVDYANLYFNGEYVKANNKRAMEILEIGCKGTGFDACQILGETYHAGEKVKKDLVKSTQYFARACDNKYDAACGELGLAYQNGEGITKDTKKAAQYFETACNAEFMYYCQTLGILYKNGDGVTKNIEKSNELLNRACSFGLNDACDAIE